MENRAKILFEANFRVYGIGHFDVTEQETNDILNLLDQPDAKHKLIGFYEQLAKQRMG